MYRRSKSCARGTAEGASHDCPSRPRRRKSRTTTPFGGVVRRDGVERVSGQARKMQRRARAKASAPCSRKSPEFRCADVKRPKSRRRRHAAVPLGERKTEDHLHSYGGRSFLLSSTSRSPLSSQEIRDSGRSSVPFRRNRSRDHAAAWLREILVQHGRVRPTRSPPFSW